MKADIDVCKQLAESIAVEFFENGHGEDLVAMEELAESKIAGLIYEHDRDLIRRAHMAYIEAVKKEGER